jgi:uncharacterized metal-binding protein
LRKLTEGLRVTEIGIKALQDADIKEQQTQKLGKELMRMLACYEEILKEK